MLRGPNELRYGQSHWRVEPPLFYNFPAQRPAHLAFGTLWVGSEPDVDQTFLLWDSSLGYVPDEIVHAAVRTFEAGIEIGTMSTKLKRGLLHLVPVHHAQESSQCIGCHCSLN